MYLYTKIKSSYYILAYLKKPTIHSWGNIIIIDHKFIILQWYYYDFSDGISSKYASSQWTPQKQRWDKIIEGSELFSKSNQVRFFPLAVPGKVSDFIDSQDQYTLLFQTEIT